MNKEPVAWINVEKRKLEFAVKDWEVIWNTPTTVKLDRIPLYTHPAKTLTDEEILECWTNNGWGFAEESYLFNFARAILRKAQDK